MHDIYVCISVHTGSVWLKLVLVSRKRKLGRSFRMQPIQTISSEIIFVTFEIRIRAQFTYSRSTIHIVHNPISV